MGHQKSIIAATSICLRRRLQPGLQQPPDLSGVVPHLPAARALLAAALNVSSVRCLNKSS